jgi:hypothetical protein
MSEFKEWWKHHSIELFGPITQADAEKLYLAGQASAEQRVKELEQERDEAVRQWERFERMAGDNWAALKAQAGEPVGYVYWKKGHAEGAINDQSLKPGTPLYVHPFAIKPITDDDFKSDEGWTPVSQEPDKDGRNATTERPYNPLNDYAVIPMNPTEPVKAQAGESRKTMFEQALDEVMETGGIFPPTERRVMEMALDVLLNVRDFSPIHGCHDTITALRNALNAAPAKGEE